MITIRALFTVTACIASGIAVGATVVRDFQGSGSMTTADFQVDAPWILDWRVNGEYELQLSFEVTLINAASGRHVGQVVKVNTRGNGVKKFEQGGRYRLRVDSTLSRWQIKIVELSESEAEQYTPKDTASNSLSTND